MSGKKLKEPFKRYQQKAFMTPFPPLKSTSEETVMDPPTSSDRITYISLKTEIPVYKLTYFVTRGYAEVSRLILHYKKIPFDDIRVNVDEYSYYKNSKFLI